MAKKYKVTILGSGQLNGAFSINETFITENFKLARSFMGGNRKEVLKNWAKNKFPGIKIDKTLSLTANVITIEEKSDSPWWKFW